jgi:hypothetical protein
MLQANDSGSLQDALKLQDSVESTQAVCGTWSEEQVFAEAESMKNLLDRGA